MDDKGSGNRSREKSAPEARTAEKPLSGVLAAASLIWSKLVGGRERTDGSERQKGSGGRARRWRLLQVETALACNLRCIMCPWKDFRESAHNHGIMSAEVWDAIRPHLSEAASVDFTGGGEPLLQPRIIEWVGDAKAAGCTAGVLTNALLLNGETARELIFAGLDWLCVSIDGADAEVYERIRVGSDFARVSENIARIAELRSGPTPRTMINFVMMSGNFHQVQDIVRLAAELRVDQVNFKQCEVIRGEHGKGHGLFESPASKETRRREKQLAAAVSLARTLGVETRVSSFSATERPVCDQDPRDSLFIGYDGVVAPCINLALGGPTTFLGKDAVMSPVHFGRLPERELPEIWESDACVRHRKCFAERARAYERVYFEALLGDSRRDQRRLRAIAEEKMPPPPPSCAVCHYLYDI